MKHACARYQSLNSYTVSHLNGKIFQIYIPSNDESFHILYVHKYKEVS